MKDQIDNAMLISPLFDIIFGEGYKLPKSEALDSENIMETVGNLSAEVSDLKRINGHYKGILLVIISIFLIKLIFG